MPQLIDDLSSQRHFIDDFVQRYGLQQQLDQSIENAKRQASSVANDMSKLLVNGATTVLNGALNVVVILVWHF